MKQLTFFAALLVSGIFFTNFFVKKSAPNADFSANTTPQYQANLVNVLSENEQKDGWQLLFDGKTLDGWRNFRKQTIGKDWVVDTAEKAIHLNAIKNPNGDWQALDGGDIVTNGDYENYEFRLDWKISPCGNSGIIYNIAEYEACEYTWNSGPEMQILDNTCHPDSKIPKHRAGDLYDLISSKTETVKPAGEWNSIRLRVNRGHLEHWLNGVKVVETDMWTPKWNAMIAASKFSTMPFFGTIKKGHISLQDHGNKVWFRNVKIKQL